MITAEKLKLNGFEPVNDGTFYEISIGCDIDHNFYLAVDTDGWMAIKLKSMRYVTLREDMHDWDDLAQLFYNLTGAHLPNLELVEVDLYNELIMNNRI